MQYFIKDNQVYAMPSSHYDGSTLYDDINDGAIQAILNPTKSTEELFTQELSELNISFESDVKSLSDSMANAMLTDGINEQSRIDELRARYAARKAQHDLDELELMQKYGLA